MKFLKITTVIVLMLALCACGSNDTAPETDAPATAPVVTEAPAQEQTEAQNPTYTVTIQDQDGNPIPGALVQLCMDTCYPGVANDQGVATFQVPEADYKVSLLSLPAGYTYATEEENFYFEDGSMDLIITLKTAE